MMTLVPLRRDASRSEPVVRDGGVDVRGTGDVDDDDLRVMGADAAHQLLGQPVGPVPVEDADDRQDEQPLPHRQHRRGEPTEGVLLLADDPLLDEADRHRVGDRFAAGS